MKPFNLEKALTGEPVKLLNGSKAYVLHQFKHKPNYLKSLLGYKIYKTDEGKLIESSLEWYADGSADVPAHNSIIGMWEEPKPKRFINGIEVPKPVTEEMWVDGEPYWYVAFDTINVTLGGHLRYHYEMDKRLIEQGLVFKTKEEAKAMAKALLNYKVEYKDGSCEETNKNNSGWIDINEKLPPFETEVLGRCIVDNEELIIIVSRESEDGEYWFSPVNFSGVCEDETVEVTHWQPLPELPQNQA